MNKKYKFIGSPAIRLMEECAEVIKAVAKAERFGYNSCDPDDVPCHSLPKEQWCDYEIIDVLNTWDDLKRNIKK